MLNFDQQHANIVRHGLAQQQADVRVQLIDIAHGMNAQTVFGHTLVVA
jgi:hypothetical protein